MSAHTKKYKGNYIFTKGVKRPKRCKVCNKVLRIGSKYDLCNYHVYKSQRQRKILNEQDAKYLEKYA